MHEDIDKDGKIDAIHEDLDGDGVANLVHEDVDVRNERFDSTAPLQSPRPPRCRPYLYSAPHPHHPRNLLYRCHLHSSPHPWPTFIRQGDGIYDLIHEDLDGDGILDVCHEDVDGDGTEDLLHDLRTGADAGSEPHGPTCVHSEIRANAVCVRGGEGDESDSTGPSGAAAGVR